jgi:hypothetical protein
MRGKRNRLQCVIEGCGRRDKMCARHAWRRLGLDDFDGGGNLPCKGIESSSHVIEKQEVALSECKYRVGGDEDGGWWRGGGS